MIATAYISSHYDLMRRFLYQMQVTWVPMIAMIVGTGLHPFWLDYFIIKQQGGVIGLANANMATNLVLLATVILTAHLMPTLRESLFWPGRESLQEWGEWFRIAVPVTIMLCAEWWAFELLIIASGYLSVDTQAAQVILWNFLLLIY